MAVCVSNPLAAPLHVQNLELLVANEGAGASGGALCYPLTLWVPAYRRHFPITLEIKLPQVRGDTSHDDPAIRVAQGLGKTTCCIHYLTEPFCLYGFECSRGS